jgi:hypothetical protein
MRQKRLKLAQFVICSLTYPKPATLNGNRKNHHRGFANCLKKKVTRRWRKWLSKPLVASKGGVTRNMHPEMSQTTRKEILTKMQLRYGRAGLEYRS